MKVRPLQDRILVRRVAEEEKTKGGIIIPDAAKEKPAEGEVIAVGNGKIDDKGKVRPVGSRRAIGFCSASTRATRSRSTASITSFCARTTSSACWRSSHGK